MLIYKKKKDQYGGRGSKSFDSGCVYWPIECGRWEMGAQMTPPFLVWAIRWVELLFKGNQEFSFKHAKFEMPTGYLMITWVCISEGSFALENIVVGWYLSLDIDELA